MLSIYSPIYTQLSNGDLGDDSGSNIPFCPYSPTEYIHKPQTNEENMR